MDIDFLDDSLASDQRAQAADALERVRGELVAWAAAALVMRRPAAVWHGRKGEALCRQDLDFHARHLHAALAHGSAADLADYARRTRALLAARGLQPDDIATGVAVLVEALARFVPEPAGTLCAEALRDAFEAHAEANSQLVDGGKVG
jgi:hypothetical protein